MTTSEDHAWIIEIGERIRKIREAKEYTQAMLAGSTELSANTISLIERGQFGNIRVYKNISRALGVTLAFLLDTETELTSPDNLSATGSGLTHTTNRVRKMLRDDFFNSPRLVRSVIEEFERQYNVKPSSTIISNVLKKLVYKRELKIEKNGRNNAYIKRQC